jgi:hypothetical protein
MQFGTGARGYQLVIDKMRQALAATLAVPVLWVSTVVFPITGLVYCLAIVALDGVEHVIRRLHAARPRRQSLRNAGDNAPRRAGDRRGRARDH